MGNCSLMEIESIAECSPLEHSAILLTSIKRLSVLKTNFWCFFEWPLKTGFTVLSTVICVGEINVLTRCRKTQFPAIKRMPSHSNDN